MTVAKALYELRGLVNELYRTAYYHAQRTSGSLGTYGRAQVKRETQRADELHSDIMEKLEQFEKYDSLFCTDCLNADSDDYDDPCMFCTRNRKHTDCYIDRYEFEKGKDTTND